jgi:hypothetical protein
MWIYRNGGDVENTGTPDGAAGRADENHFALVPAGGKYQIKWLSGEFGPECLGVRAAPEGGGTLVTTGCEKVGATSFAISPTGGRDAQGRAAHHIVSDAYGAVEWSAQRNLAVVAGPGVPARTSFTFLDRGPV